MRNNIIEQLDDKNYLQEPEEKSDAAAKEEWEDFKYDMDRDDEIIRRNKL